MVANETMADKPRPIYALMISREGVDALCALAGAAQICVDQIDKMGSKYPQDVLIDVYDRLTGALKLLEKEG